MDTRCLGEGGNKNRRVYRQMIPSRIENPGGSISAANKGEGGSCNHISKRPNPEGARTEKSRRGGNDPSC